MILFRGQEKLTPTLFKTKLDSDRTAMNTPISVTEISFNIHYRVRHRTITIFHFWFTMINFHKHPPIFRLYTFIMTYQLIINIKKL